jgi:hypothetical protein
MRRRARRDVLDVTPAPAVYVPDVSSLKEAKRRLEEELWTECRANAAYEACRARGVMQDGRRFGGPPTPYQPPAVPQGKINVTDPDSRLVKGMRGWVQGYNARAATNDQQIVIAAEVTVDSPG